MLFDSFGVYRCCVAFCGAPGKAIGRSFSSPAIIRLYVTSLFFIILYKILGSELFYANLSSLIVLIPLLILWFLGFKAAMEDKETPMPLMGRVYQKWFVLRNLSAIAAI